MSVGEAGPASAHLLGELSVLSSSGVGLDLLDPEAETALAELGARSLVAFSRDDTTAFVHRLVRRAVRDQAERDRTLAAMIETAARRLLVAAEVVTDEDTWRKFPTIMAVADHATALWEAVEQFPDDESAQIRAAAEVVLRVRQVVANHLIYLNDQVRAFPIAEAVVTGREKFLGAEHPDTLTALHNLAHAAAYEAAGRTADAVAEYEWVANRFEAVMGPEQTLTKTARDNLERARRSLQRR
ncbi:hypothetical protein GCM10009609_26670 [Pseudonocardia aurantiaca]|uniref:Tetratricopeptide repeat protein n=1 Tax=Pseudonocardia aurantiaca TaxID=75290 RepID=A0ABW4FK46_9PSEU